MTRRLLFTLSRRTRRWMVAFGALILSVVVALVWPMSALFRDPCSTVLLDRNGELLGATVAADGQWRFPATDSVPERFATCLIQFEDRHFLDHTGVHLPSLARAVKQNLSSGRRVSGGSTLTMQVARLSYRGAGRTYGQKIQEIITAWRMELRYSKQEILGLFASHAPFGGNVVGLEAAAWRYYGRPPAQLSWSECATLAVLPNAPSAIYPGRGQQQLVAKRDRLLDRLLLVHAIDSMEWSLARAEPLPGKAFPLPQRAPHLLATLRGTGREGTVIHSTIDGRLQDRATTIVSSYGPVLAANEVHNAAAVVLDLASGEVLAYVGNLGDAGAQHAGSVDIVRARRSTGSLLKPFLYADMLRTGELLPDMLVADIPTRYEGFDPRNFDERYQGVVPASTALARSLNVPAVRCLRSHGVEPTMKVVRAMGVAGIEKNAAHYGLSLIVGGAESDLLSLTGAYANMGRILLRSGSQRNSPVIHAPITVKAIEPEVDPRSDLPLSPGSIHFTLKALREVKRPESEGGWSYFNDAQGIAWKTGTSMGHRDAWAVGLTTGAAVGVWTGNADGEGRPGLTGTLAAAPILFELFRQLPASAPFDLPYDDMIQLPVCRRSGHRSNADCPVVDTLWMPRGAERSLPCPYHHTVYVDAAQEHRMPAGNNAALAVWFTLPPAMEHYYAPTDPAYRPLPPWKDPAIAAAADRPMEMIYPENGARVMVPTEFDNRPGRAVFEAAHRDRTIALHWHLDGDFMGTTKGDHHLAVNPSPGDHTLLLTDANGQTLAVRFVVVSGPNASGQ